MSAPGELMKCASLVCFKEGRRYKLAGTAFFFGLEMKKTNKTFVYAVAPKRVIAAVLRKGIDEKVYMRVNFKAGRGSFLKIDLRQWRFHPTDPSIDVAVLPWVAPGNLLDFEYVPSEMAATDEVIEKEQIGVGDRILLTGVYASHFDPKANLAILRAGRIVQMDDGPVRTRDMGDMHAYLVEAYSFGGLTGSPVFVRLPGWKRRKASAKAKGEKFYLLGLLRGDWNLPPSDTDLVIEEIPGKDNLNAGIGIVTPVVRILDVLDQPELVALREPEEHPATEEEEGDADDSLEPEAASKTETPS